MSLPFIKFVELLRKLFLVFLISAHFYSLYFALWTIWAGFRLSQSGDARITYLSAIGPLWRPHLTKSSHASKLRYPTLKWKRKWRRRVRLSCSIGSFKSDLLGSNNNFIKRFFGSCLTHTLLIVKWSLSHFYHYKNSVNLNYLIMRWSFGLSTTYCRDPTYCR